MRQISRIPLERLRNTRDLGGFETESGRRIRPRRLLRSGELFPASERDLAVLKEEYDLSAVVDFRTALERTQHPDPELEGVLNVHLPILDEQTVGVTKEQEEEDGLLRMLLRLIDQPGGADGYMAGVYGSIVESSFARNQYRKFFELLLKEEEGSVLWHCSAGKDRAGTGAALVLTALGVPRDLVMADYLMVNEFTREGIDALAQQVYEQTGSQKAADIARGLTGAKEIYLQSVFDRIDADFGGMDAFLTEEMGLGGENRARLWDLYLE